MLGVVVVVVVVVIVVVVVVVQSDVGFNVWMCFFSTRHFNTVFLAGPFSNHCTFIFEDRHPLDLVFLMTKNLSMGFIGISIGNISLLCIHYVLERYYLEHKYIP